MAADKLRKKLAKGRHISVIKRARQGEKHRARNKGILSGMKTAMKKVRASVSAEDLKAAIPIIARTAKKGAVHRKKASRIISRLTKAVNKAARA